MQVKSIAECSKGSILQYFRPSLGYHLSLRYLFCLCFSGHLRQVLLYITCFSFISHSKLILWCYSLEAFRFLFYTPPLKCGEVLCYTLRCLSVRPSVRPSVRLSVRPSVRPCSPFPIDNLSIYSRNFFKFCIHIVIGDEWCGIVNGQNPSIFNGVTALFRIGKMVSGLLFLYCS